MISMFNNIFQSQFKRNNSTLKFRLFSREKDSRRGLVYTLYSDQLNLIEIGYAKNNKILEDKIKEKQFILLEKKYGNPLDLFLIIKTLKLLNVEFLNSNYFILSYKTLRHLKTLGWPIGNSLYKKRIIRKKISYALT
tara:strand:+ start:2916 stop:3326 length:411 start_codon:yes stop_codon:yes gene_type:complete